MYKALKAFPKDFENELQIYVKLFTVLYADDTVLLTECSEDTFGVKNQSLIHSNSHNTNYFSIMC